MKTPPPPEAVKLLGKAPDKYVAALFSVGSRVAHSWRTSRGIEAVKLTEEWENKINLLFIKHWNNYTPISQLEEIYNTKYPVRHANHLRDMGFGLKDRGLPPEPLKVWSNLHRVPDSTLIEEYKTDGAKTIAKRYGCSNTTVIRRLRSLGIQIKPQGGSKAKWLR